MLGSLVYAALKKKMLHADAFNLAGSEPMKLDVYIYIYSYIANKYGDIIMEIHWGYFWIDSHYVTII